MSLSELIIDIPAEYEMNVFGQFDTYIKKIERTFHVTLISRDGATKIVGDTIAAQKAQRVLTQLVELAKRGNTITEQNVDYAISYSCCEIACMESNLLLRSNCDLAVK